MTEFFRQQMFNIIAAVFLGLFVAVWGAVLLRVGFWVPDGRNQEALPSIRRRSPPGCPGGSWPP
jgi:hypothetical protein